MERVRESERARKRMREIETGEEKERYIDRYNTMSGYLPQRSVV